MKKVLTIVFTALFLSITAFAQDVPASTWGNLPPLHVEGNHLVDPYGNNVVLHGVMDTPSPYFNNNRWKGPGWGEDFNTTHAKNAIAYFDKLFTAITDTASGAYCNLFRLHLDPCWTNYNNTKAPGFTEKNGKVYDPHGNEVSGEANIYHFNKGRLKQFLKTLYFPIAKKAIDHGLYVIMRPPGVFPGYVQVGDYYNDYIQTVWDIVTQNDSIKKYSGQIMIELGNEPVTLNNAQGKGDDKALCDFFQPVVDKMRENGYEGVIWGVGTGWQGNCRSYGKYPIVGKNIGYAVHNYVGWYGGNDRKYSSSDKEKYANEFHASHPIMDTNPIVITEIDWSPEKEGTGHYNEHGDWVLSNYGSWATGTTSGWGAAYKYLLDKYDNISMTLSGTHCYIDVDDYINLKKVTPAYKTAMEKNGLDPWEASGVACFSWYKDWAQENYARPDLTQVQSKLVELTTAKGDGVVNVMVGQSLNLGLEGKFEDGLTSKIPTSLMDIEAKESNILEKKGGVYAAVAEGAANCTASFGGMTTKVDINVLPAFSLSDEVFNPSIFGTGSYLGRQGKLQTAVNGLAGWQFDAGIDLSAYDYLNIDFVVGPSCKPFLRIFDSEEIGANNFYEYEIGKNSSVKIPLKNQQKGDNTVLDLSNIRTVAFTSNGGSYIYIKNVALEVDPTAIAGVENNNSAKVVAEEYYTVSGIRLNTLSKGVNIVRQKLSNGEQKTQKIIIEK
ncbi:MAG: hypothetical protein KBT29_09510 [Prevotellaceae bacterium]|nr:hypothetical protein [Candidatus Minthosoma caballi]